MLLSSLTASVTLSLGQCLPNDRGERVISYMSWLGFFFFLRIAVAVSSSCSGVSNLVCIVTNPIV